MASKKERSHYDLKEIENYCRTKTFPKRLAGKREKQILDKLQSDSLLKIDSYKESRLVIADKHRQVDIIHDIHEG